MDIKKIGKIGYYGFFGALGALAVVMLVSVFPIPGNYQFMVVQSGSMEPTIKIGSVVLVKPASAYQIGDIITFKGGFRNARGENLPVTHRIVEMRVDSGVPLYTMKGDANDSVDTREIGKGQIIGKVLFDIPYVGYAVEAARTPYGFLSLIIIPAALIGYDQVARIWKEVKRMKQEKNGVHA